MREKEVLKQEVKEKLKQKKLRYQQPSFAHLTPDC